MDNLELLLEKRGRINDRISALSERKAEYDQAIKNVLGSHQKVTVGKYHVSWTESVSRRIDTKRIKAEIPEVVEKYMKESKSDRLTISVRKPLEGVDK
jgi:predicted phage-related endonuclease